MSAVAARTRGVVAALFAALLTGCPESTPPDDDAGGASEDAGLDVDGSSAVGVDTDQDGLCDRTEPSYGTDPLNPDSDADGYPDGTEVIDGDDPALPTEPVRDRIVFLTEEMDATAVLTVTVVVRAAGESYSGAFQTFTTRDAFGRDASALYAGAAATLANPPDNVIAIEDEQFIGVNGRTLLAFDVSFAFGEEIPRACATAYPFRYNVKRQDGRFVSTTRYTLVVLPPGQTPSSSPWCVLSGCF